MNNKIPLYVLNNFLKFERKIYQVFGLQLGRALSVKTVIYFFAIGAMEVIIYNTPVIGNLINWLPFSILLLIPIGLAWLLADVVTEGRSPIYFFQSFLAYQKRKYLDKQSFFRGRSIAKQREYQFRGYMTVRESKEESILQGTHPEYDVIEKAKLESHKNGLLQNLVINDIEETKEPVLVRPSLASENETPNTNDALNDVHNDEESNVNNVSLVHFEKENPTPQSGVKREKENRKKKALNINPYKESKRKTSLWQFLIMAMRYRARTKNTKKKSKRK
ncbi:hypothetical protein GY31_13255 [Lysinibacillus sphaericus]|uniref:TcpE family conjugal transfer membrane protein n=1 Tax=Lysinibacillus TaxID=400634 RepID=UPI00084B0794|nr:TcpE family conjugal transfer membrane protein [Lysinibacillus sphaericus]OEC01268.1 hypothetical protein GY31_13255 [Lysinibacillus sphaericus]